LKVTKPAIAASDYAGVCGNQPFKRGIHKWTFITKGSHWMNVGLLDKAENTSMDGMAWNNNWSIASDC